MVRVYCDGVFDLFHRGHRKHLQTIKYLYPDVVLIVGVLSDKDTTDYKRVPGQSESVRYYFIKNCKYVDEIVTQAPEIVTEQFMDTYHIDLVVHAFSDDADFKKQEHFFKVPISLGKFKRLEYNTGISTSQIINSDLWKKYQFDKSDKRGKINKSDKNDNENDNNDNENDNNDNEICSRSNRIDSINSKTILQVQNLIQEHITNNDNKILEINFGNGEIGDYLREHYGNNNYTGQDILQDNVTKYIKTGSSRVFCADLNTEGLIFSDKIFDWIIARDIDLTNVDIVNEIKRVARKGCIIVGIPLVGNYSHLRDFNLIIDESKNIEEGYTRYYHAIYNFK